MATDKYLDPAQNHPQPDLELSASHPYQGIEVHSRPALATLLRQPPPTPAGVCPQINATRYAPREATNGTGITLQGQTYPQPFVQLCSTNFPEGDDKPGVRDIVSFFAPTFEQCMLSCAQYNRQYQQ
ncbi:hypothetical protein PG996_004634 [Apiospora saccharicola]|uniref:Uncharacterized protein n=1 Tax=Apiospora saccharicola TaxID=335842 RepID=A0ABR1W4Q6_9PEZI